VGFESYHYYRPADSVGGDSFYYDAYQNYLFVSIFDVTGHGISAAIMTGLIAGALKKLFHYEVRLIETPEQLLNQIAMNLNQTILNYNRDQRGHLATVTFGLLDQETQCFYYLNSGHIPSYLIRTGKIEVLTSPGSPLGLRHDPIFHVKIRTMEDDDKLLFLTDGILENAAMDGRPVKEYALFRELKKHMEYTPHKLGQHLEHFLAGRFQTARLEDDMTFLVIGRVANDHKEVLVENFKVANG
jgi:serine phosphatase RsbU (regulator of sigma subunit)